MSLSSFLLNAKRYIADFLKVDKNFSIYAPECLLVYTEPITPTTKTEVLGIISRSTNEVTDTQIGGWKAKAITRVGGTGMQRYLTLDILMQEQAEYSEKWSYGGKNFSGRISGTCEYVFSIRLDLIMGQLTMVFGIKMMCIPKPEFDSPLSDRHSHSRLITYVSYQNKTGGIKHIKKHIEDVFKLITEKLHIRK
ncbi:MAG: hypothetical protein Q6363_005165 [Candidatus Njordarchaeota archaeon]